MLSAMLCSGVLGQSVVFPPILIGTQNIRYTETLLVFCNVSETTRHVSGMLWGSKVTLRTCCGLSRPKRPKDMDFIPSDPQLC